MADSISDQFSSIKGLFSGGNKSPSSVNLDPTTGDTGGSKLPTWLRVASPVTNLFSGLVGTKQDPSSYTSMGNQYKLGDIAYEGVGGNQDSLTQMLRSLTNYGGMRGQQLSDVGDTTFGTGMGVTGAGLSLYDQPVSYWSSLLSGDPTETTKALSPEASTIAQQYGKAQTSAERDMPMGGYRAGSVANMPFAQAGAVGNAALNLRPVAANAMSGMAKDISGIGTDVSKIGLGEQGLGQSFWQDTMNSLLSRRGVNAQVDQSNKQMATDAIMKLLAALI